MSIRKAKANYTWIAAIVLAAGLAACASKPPPAPAPPEAQVPPSDPALAQAFKDAQDEAAKEQKLAEDFGGSEYAADAYRQAQSLAAEAKGLTPASAEDYRAATAKYKAAAEAFRGVSAEALPQFFADKARTAGAAGEKAAAAGAGQKGVWEAGTEQLALADQDAAEGEGLYNSKDYYGAAASYDSALSRYEVVEAEAQCYTLKAEIEQHGLQNYDPGTYAQGEGDLEKAAAAYNDKDFAAAKTAAAAALAGYQTVADSGWEKLAAEQGDAARARRDKALEIKADVAMKDDYNTAAASYTQGEAGMEQKNFKRAYGDFSQALALFTSVYDRVSQKRLAADALIKQADKKVAESGDRLKSIQSQQAVGSSPRR